MKSDKWNQEKTFALFKLAKEPHLKAERATVAMQLWPFCKPVWVLSGQFSPPNMCQQNSNDWLSELWKRHKNRLFAPEWLCVANIASREAENEQIVWQDSVRQFLSLKRPTPALPVGREWRTRAAWRPTPAYWTSRASVPCRIREKTKRAPYSPEHGAPIFFLLLSRVTSRRLITTHQKGGSTQSLYKI